MTETKHQSRQERRAAARRAAAAKQRPTGRRPTPKPRFGRRSQRRELYVIGAVVVVVLVGAVLFRSLGNSESSNGLPGPRGGPSISQDVGTRVGQPAPGFTLTDADGRSYTVAPGNGKPLVIVFHMGIT